MRVFLAGATGVIGSRLVPLLVREGHTVTGMTRSPDKAEALVAAGAEAVACDVFDLISLQEVVERSQPDLVMHQLTDLPDDISRIGDFAASHNRIRREGTRNLAAAAKAAGARRFLAQSVAWELPGDSGAAVAELEQMTLEYPGVVLRYGQFYGPGTYHPRTSPAPPAIHIDAAAARTVAMLDSDPGIVEIAED